VGDTPTPPAWRRLNWARCAGAKVETGGQSSGPLTWWRLELGSLSLCEDGSEGNFPTRLAFVPPLNAPPSQYPLWLRRACCFWAGPLSLWLPISDLL